MIDAKKEISLNNKSSDLLGDLFGNNLFGNNLPDNLPGVFIFNSPLINVPYIKDIPGKGSYRQRP